MRKRVMAYSLRTLPAVHHRLYNLLLTRLANRRYTRDSAKPCNSQVYGVGASAVESLNLNVVVSQCILKNHVTSSF